MEPQVFKMTIVVRVVDEARLLALSEKIGRTDPGEDEDGKALEYSAIDALSDVFWEGDLFHEDCLEVVGTQLRDWTKEQAAEDARWQQQLAEARRSK